MQKNSPLLQEKEATQILRFIFISFLSFLDSCALPFAIYLLYNYCISIIALY